MTPIHTARRGERDRDLNPDLYHPKPICSLASLAVCALGRGGGGVWGRQTTELSPYPLSVARYQGNRCPRHTARERQQKGTTLGAVTQLIIVTVAAMII